MPVKKTLKKKPAAAADREFAVRLEQAIRARSLSHTELAGRLGRPWTPTRVSEYCNARKRPGLKSIRQLTIFLSVRADWLLHGDGSMFREQSRDPQSLEQDFRAHIRRLAAAQLRDSGALAIGENDLEVNFEELNRSLVDQASTEIRRQLARLRDIAFEYRLSIKVLLAHAREEQAKIKQAYGKRLEGVWLNDARPLFRETAERRFEEMFRELLDGQATPLSLNRGAVTRIVDNGTIAAALEERTRDEKPADHWSDLALRGNPRFCE